MILNKFIQFLKGKEGYVFGRLAFVILDDAYPYYQAFRIGLHVYNAIKIGPLAIGWEICHYFGMSFARSIRPGASIF